MEHSLLHFVGKEGDSQKGYLTCHKLSKWQSGDLGYVLQTQLTRQCFSYFMRVQMLAVVALLQRLIIPGIHAFLSSLANLAWLPHKHKQSTPTLGVVPGSESHDSHQAFLSDFFVACH